MKFALRRIDITSGLDEKIIKEAQNTANKHAVGQLQELVYTENDYKWVLLYDHIKKGQITPHAMRRMKRKDLYYIAGLSFPHPELLRAGNRKNYDKITTRLMPEVSEDERKRWGELSKIQGNAIRAQEELRFRNFFWATIFVVVGAMIGPSLDQILERMI